MGGGREKEKLAWGKEQRLHGHAGQDKPDWSTDMTLKSRRSSERCDKRNIDTVSQGVIDKHALDFVGVVVQLFC